MVGCSDFQDLRVANLLWKKIIKWGARKPVILCCQSVPLNLLWHERGSCPMHMETPLLRSTSSRRTPNADISATRSSVHVPGGSRVAFTSCLLAILLGTPCWYRGASESACTTPRLGGVGVGCRDATLLLPVDSLWSPTKVSLFLLRWLRSCESPKKIRSKED